ncbi:MAG TPA: hypothetical protein VGB14_17350 [Acidimicrobiales bacterium]
MRRRLALAAASALAAGAVAALVPATPAGASPSCRFDAGSRTVVVDLPADADVGVLLTEPDGDIAFEFRLCLDGATPATVTTTDLVVVRGGAGRQEITVDLSDGPFAPGATDEAGGSDEIELRIDLAGGGEDRVILTGSYGRDTWRLSDAGLNLNASETTGVDTDATLTGVEHVDAFSSRGDDLLDATGWSGDVFLSGGADEDVLRGGRPPAGGISRLDGGTEDDRLEGGPGADDLLGFYGDDVLVGNGGDDVFEAGANEDGADVISGGPGRDLVTYLARSAGVAISLNGRADDGEAGEGDDVGGDVEDLTGSKGADRITGDDGANTLRGLDRDDVLDGRGGADRLEGDDGADGLTGGGGVDALYGGGGGDDLDAADGVADLADGGAGTDTCRCDRIDNVRSVP